MHKFVLFFSILLLLFSCKREKEGIVHIEGQFPDAGNKKVYLIKAQHSQGHMGFYKAVDSTKADTTGKFSFSTSIRGADFYQIRGPLKSMLWGHDLFLQPEDSLEITSNTVKGNTLTLTKINEFPIRRQEEFPHELSRWITMQPKAFKKTIEQRQSKMKSYTGDYFKSIEAPGRVLQRYQQEVILHTTNIRLQYLENHNYYAYGQWHPMPLDSMNFSPSLNSVINDTTWYFLHDYLDLIQNTVTAKYHTHFFNPLDAHADKKALLKRKTLIDTMFNGIQKDIALSTLANDFWRYLPAMQERFYEDTKTILRYFDQNKSRKQYYNFYKTTYDKFHRIKPGNKAPDFRLQDTSGTNISLKDFRGDFVYLTFWNTRNRIFVSNLDQYRRLTEELENYNNVSQIYIAMQPDHPDAIKAWKYFIKEYPFGENHLVAPGMMENEAIAPYLIEALPAHVLINPSGEIITPRASGPEKAAETIAKLMGQQLRLSQGF